jgi:hypothetical protein
MPRSSPAVPPSTEARCPERNQAAAEGTGCRPGGRIGATRDRRTREERRRIRLDKLKPSDVEALVLAMRAKTKRGKRTEKDLNPEPVRALSDATIRQTYTVLRAGLDGAVRDGLLAKNPAAAVTRSSATASGDSATQGQARRGASPCR